MLQGVVCFIQKRWTIIYNLLRNTSFFPYFAATSRMVFYVNVTKGTVARSCKSANKLHHLTLPKINAINIVFKKFFICFNVLISVLDRVLVCLIKRNISVPTYLSVLYFRITANKFCNIYIQYKIYILKSASHDIIPYQIINSK